MLRTQEKSEPRALSGKLSLNVLEPARSKEKRKLKVRKSEISSLTTKKGSERKSASLNDFRKWDRKIDALLEKYHLPVGGAAPRSMHGTWR